MVTIGGVDDGEGEAVCAAGAGVGPPGVVGTPALAPGEAGGVVPAGAGGAPGETGAVGAGVVPWGVVGVDGAGAGTVTAPPVNPARYPEMPDATPCASGAAKL